MSGMDTQIRMSVARCAQGLIGLPAEVIVRHRDTAMLPLLLRLLDDPSQRVRLEAARAQNLWLLRT